MTDLSPRMGATPFDKASLRIIIGDPGKSGGQVTAARVAAFPKYEVIATAHDLSDIYTLSEHQCPDVVLLDEALAQVAEFEVLQLLFRALNIRCVVTTHRARPTPQALFQPAAKPVSSTPVQGLTAAILSGRADCALPLAERSRVQPAAAQPEPTQFDDGVILIGASTGGVDALIQVLSTFPRACPPTLIVQHTGATFTTGLARLIDGQVAPSVVEAQDGQIAKKGTVLIAPGGEHHLETSGRQTIRCQLRRGDLCNGHRPSVDRLFQSAAPLAKRVSAAILTGMGRDGTAGLLELKNAGAVTIGQDAATSVVYGMPRIAFDAGAVTHQLPLPKIGPALLKTRQICL